MKKRHLLKTMLLLFALIVGVGSSWAEDVTGTINFGSGTGSTNVNSASVTGKDSQGNTWTVTTVGTTSFTANANYAQIGSSNKPATSITFTTTLSNDVNITAFSAKFGGFNGTAGTVTLKVGETTVGTGSLNATNDVTVSSTSSVTGKVLTVTVTGISKGVKAYNISYTYSKGPAKTPIATIDATLPASLNYGATGTFIADITSAEGTTADDYEVTWRSSDSDKLSVDNTGAYTAGTTKGEVTVTVNVEPVDDATYSSVSKEFTINIVDPNANDGSAEKPYTVAEARAAIDANSGVAGVYATGIVSEIVTAYNSQYGNISYNISADGLTTSDQLQAYRGKSYNGDNFTSEDDIQVGDIVVVYGNLKKYNSTYEFDANNQLVSLKRAGVANLVFGQESYTVGVGGNLTITATSSDSDGAITYSSSNTDVAEIDATTGVVTAKAEGTTIITATIAATDELKGTTATVELTVTDSRAEAGLAWSGEEVNIELNAEEGDYTLPTLTNPNNLTVTYSSSNETVALVDETTGEVIVETSAEGTATITATFAGNDTYKAGSASYTITITDPNQKGTKLNPYTVAEVISGTAKGSGVYVLGYIVGEFVGSSTDPRTSNFSTDANVALADEFTTSPEVNSSIPVQFTTDALKKAWGNQSRSDAMGYQVLVKGNVETYFSVKGIKSTTEVEPLNKIVNVSAAKYATFSAEHSMDFSETGITVYSAKSNGTSVSLTKVEDGIVPAKTGVVLFSESVVTNKNVPITTTTKTTLENNEMAANIQRAMVYKSYGNNTNYILSNESAGVGFYLAAEDGAYLPANRAYLSTTTTATGTGNAPFLGFDGNETTGINSVERGALSVEGCYTLDGRRVAQPTKGLYIVNGRKVIIK